MSMLNGVIKSPTPKIKKAAKAAAPVKHYVEAQRIVSTKLAPYDDFDQEALYDLALIRHPDGTVGRVVYLPQAADHWMVLYEDGKLLPLYEQVTEGQAIRIGLPELAIRARGRVIPPISACELDE